MQNNNFLKKKETTHEDNIDVDEDRIEAAEQIKKNSEVKYLGYKLSKVKTHDKVKCGKFTICPVLFLNKHKFIVYREVNQECSPFR